MDENLQRLVSTLRNEVCPRSVHDEVARRISAQAPPVSPFRFALPVSVAIALVLCCLLVLRWPESHRREPPRELAQQTTLERAQVVAQAEGALGYIGNTLLSAGARSEKAIYKQAVPPFQNRLESSTDKIIKLLNQ